MKFCWTTIMVNDLEESLKFYQEIIGLPVNKRFKGEKDMEIIFLGDGETKLELISSKTDKKVNIGPDISIGFEVESVDRMISNLKTKGIDIYSGPFQPNPNIRFFYLLDPNGLKVQLVENIV